MYKNLQKDVNSQKKKIENLDDANDTHDHDFSIEN